MHNGYYVFSCMMAGNLHNIYIHIEHIDQHYCQDNVYDNERDSYYNRLSQKNSIVARCRPRFFDQVGHQTTYAFTGNRHFFTISCHHQTYQYNEQS